MTAADGRAERAVREKLGQHRPGLKALLLPQEHLLAQTDFSRADGKNRLETSPDTVSRGKKAALIPLSVVFSDLPSPSPKRMLGGVSAEGRLGSWASRLIGASRDLGTNRGKHLLVTDRRVLLASSKIFGKDPDYAIALEIPQDALADVALESRPFTRGRVVLRFTDGSMIALDFGTWRTAKARSFIQVFARRAAAIA